MALRGRVTALRMTTESLSKTSGLKNYLSKHTADKQKPPTNAMSRTMYK